MAISNLNCLSSYWQIKWQIYPPPTKHRSLEHHYTKSGRSSPQLTIDPLNTTTPNKLICTSSYWQIKWQIYPPPIDNRFLEHHYTKSGRSTPPLIDHRSIEHHYTKSGRSTPMGRSAGASEWQFHISTIRVLL